MTNLMTNNKTKKWLLTNITSSTLTTKYSQDFNTIVNIIPYGSHWTSFVCSLTQWVILACSVQGLVHPSKPTKCLFHPSSTRALCQAGFFVQRFPFLSITISWLILASFHNLNMLGCLNSSCLARLISSIIQSS
jgi:hypothetical protein